MAMLSVHAVHRGQKRSMPIAGAAISSSRVATAKRPIRVSRNAVTTNSAAKAATHSHVFVSMRGHAGQAAGTTRHLLPVLHGLVDDEQDRQRDHRRSQSAGAGDRHADGRTDGDGDDDADERGADGTELDVAEAERQIGQCGRLRRHGDGHDRRAVGGDLGEGEVSERQDPRRPDERLQPQDEQEVDQQLLDQQLPSRTARRRVDDRPTRSTTNSAAARQRGCAGPPSHPLRGPHGEQALRPHDEQDGDQHEDDSVGQPLPHALRQVAAQHDFGEA